MAAQELAAHDHPLDLVSALGQLAARLASWLIGLAPASAMW